MEALIVLGIGWLVMAAPLIWLGAPSGTGAGPEWEADRMSGG